MSNSALPLGRTSLDPRPLAAEVAHATVHALRTREPARPNLVEVNVNGASNGHHHNGHDHGSGHRHIGACTHAKGSHADPAMFRETAVTVLPIEYRGTEVLLDAHAYEDDSASYQALALVRSIKNGKTELPLVRVHSGCVTGDIFHSLRCDCYLQLQISLDRIIESHSGVVIYLPHHEGRGIGLVNKIKAYAEQDRGLDTVDANISIGAPVDARDYELAAKILTDLGFSEIRLLTNNPLKVEALERFGIKVVEQVEIVTSPSPHNSRYLATKRERMSHKL